MTNKAYNFHVKHLLGLTLIMAFGAFICFPLGQFILPESLLATQVATLGLGLAGGILLAECILLVPAINKLRKKMGELIKKAV